MGRFQILVLVELVPQTRQYTAVKMVVKSTQISQWKLKSNWFLTLEVILLSLLMKDLCRKPVTFQDKFRYLHLTSPPFHRGVSRCLVEASLDGQISNFGASRISTTKIHMYLKVP